MTKHGKWALALLFAPFLLKLGGCQSSPDPATSEENATGDGSNGSGLNSSNSLDAEPLDGGDPLSNTINGNGSLNSEAGAGNVKSVQNKSLNSTLFANSNPPPNAPTTNGGPSPAPANSPTPSNSPAPANSLGALPDLPPILGNTPGGNTPSPAANTVRAEPSPTMEVPPLATPPPPGPGAPPPVHTVGLPAKGLGFTVQEAEFWKEKAKSLRDLIPGEAPDSYAVISGDTLWEIAEQIIGDPFWWPKLWLFNPQVKNPHWIVPGTVLHFYARGSGGGGTIDTDGNEAVDVPPPTTQPVLLAKPNSPHMGDPVKEDPWAKGKLILEDQEAGASQLVEVIGEMKGAEGELVLLPGFFVKGDVETLGNVMDVRSNALVPQKGALLYALLNDAPAGGQKLLLARKGMQPRTPTMETPSENFWTIVAECGVVNTKDDITTVMILNTFQSIELGDVFIPYQNLYFPFTPGLAKDSLPPAKSNAAIIGVGDGSRVSAGKGMVVFLSQPEEGPWNPGEILPIYMPPGGTVSFEEAHMPALQVGKVQVVHGTPEWALGVVTEAKREITVGAQTTPQFQSGPFSEE